MGDNPHANGGLLLKDLKMPNFEEYALDVPKPGKVMGESTRTMGMFLRDVMKLNLDASNFRVMGPDEVASNRLGNLFEVTDRVWMEPTIPQDDHLSPNGRVMEILSEHTCQGWLEGYLLTGVMVCLPLMRHSSTLSIPCSINMRNGLKSLVKFHGEDPSLP